MEIDFNRVNGGGMIKTANPIVQISGDQDNWVL